MHPRFVLSLVLVALPFTAIAGEVTDEELGVSDYLVSPDINGATDLEWAPDGSSRLFVVLKNGQIRLIENGVLQPEPFLTESVYTASENGLLSLAFDPDYVLNRYLYVFASISPSEQAIIRYTDRGTSADARTVLVERLPNLGQNHVGGGMAFGPDGRLFWGIGDLGNGTGVDSDLVSMAAKISRANPDGSPAQDSPFNDGVGPNNEYIYARGFRNPFGLTFHPRTGALWVNVAGTSYEQVFEVPRRGHAGYDDYEANQPESGDYIRPRIAYRTNGSDQAVIVSDGAARENGQVTFVTSSPHRFRPGQRLTVSGMSDPSFHGTVYVRSVPSDTSFTALQAGPDAIAGGGAVRTDALGGSVTRGVFYDATLLPETYAENFLFGDFNQGRLIRAQFEGDAIARVDAWGEDFPMQVDLAVGPDGALYTVGFGGGRIQRIAPISPEHRLVLAHRHVRVVEGGEREVSVSLSREPETPVTVQIVGTHLRFSVEPSSLTFTAADWQTPRALRIVAVDAAADDVATFSLAAPGYAPVPLEVMAFQRVAQAFGVAPRRALTLARGEQREIRVQLQLRPKRTVDVTARLEGTSSLLSITEGASFSFSPSTWEEGAVIVVEAAASEAEPEAQADALIIEAPGVPPYRLELGVRAFGDPGEPDGGTGDGGDNGDGGTGDGGVDAPEEVTAGCGCNTGAVGGVPLLLGAILLLGRSRRRMPRVQEDERSGNQP